MGTQLVVKDHRSQVCKGMQGVVEPDAAPPWSAMGYHQGRLACGTIVVGAIQPIFDFAAVNGNLADGFQGMRVQANACQISFSPVPVGGTGCLHRHRAR